MSVLLRHPATVPALFARSVDPDTSLPVAPTLWNRLAGRVPLVVVSAWAVLVLVEVPLVEAAAAAVGLALPR